MREFKPENDSLLLQKWWIDLDADPREFELLFTKPLRNLSAIAAWTQTIKVFIEEDWRGIWFAGWIAPWLTNGAEVGAWIRKDRRGMPRTLKAVDYFYDEIVLKGVPTFIGITRQYPQLHALHLKLGYTFVDEFPGIFDGESVWMYKMTRESRAGRAVAIEAQRQERAARRAAHASQQRQIEQSEQSMEPVRGDAGEVRDPGSEGVGARISRFIESRKRSTLYWWGDKSNPD